MTQIDTSHKNEGKPSGTNGKQINTNEDQFRRKENKLEDANFINMDDIFHLDSIPGLANILADDSIDPSSFGDNSDIGLGSGNQTLHSQKFNNDLKDGGSKFSQFFQQDSQQTVELKPNSSNQVLDGIGRNKDHDELKFKGIHE